MTLRLGIVVLYLLASAALAGEKPPVGPPWVRELAEAQADALAHKRPIFAYFTKTY